MKPTTRAVLIKTVFAATKAGHRLMPLLSPKARKVAGDLSGIAAEYSAALKDALFAYANGSMGMVEARNDMIQAMAAAFDLAFDAAWVEGGAELPTDEEASAWLGSRENAEVEHIRDVFRTLKDWQKDNPDGDIGAWISERSAGYIGSLNDVYSMGLVFAAGSQMLTFDGDDGQENCPTCARLKGQRHKARWWIENDLVPTQGNSNFECGCWNCQHGLQNDAGEWVTLNPSVFKMAVSDPGTSGEVERLTLDGQPTDEARQRAIDLLDSLPVYPEADLPAQLQEDPNSEATMRHAKRALASHDPVEFVFAQGTDIVTGEPMVAEQYDGPWVRNNIWQDVTAGINASRYQWWKPGHYGVDSTTTGIEVLVTLLHETVEDLTMRLKGQDYGDAHSLHANPVELKARHSDPEEVLLLLRLFGWDV
jgi:hypothetical protein